MLTPTLRKGSELSTTEKADIFARMSLSRTKKERDSMRESLTQQYGITKESITSLISHETMRRMKNGEGTQQDLQSGNNIDASGVEGEGIDDSSTQIVQESTQARVYTITTLTELTEEIRTNVIEDFGDVIKNDIGGITYDYYQDIEALSEYYNITPAILEQFLRNRYSWLGEKLDELKKGKILSEEDKMNIRLYVGAGIDEKDKKVRRKEMAGKYGVSIKVVGPITAWKIHDNSGKKVLKKDDGKTHTLIISKGETEPVLDSPQIKDENQVNLNSTIIDGDDEDNSENNEGEQVSCEMDIDYINDLVLEYNLQDNEQRGEFLQHVFDLFPDATIDDVKKIIPDFPDDAKHKNIKRGGEGMGALMEYNNDIKNKWRQKLKEFIDENTDAAKQKDMKVLCLPEVECLEIPLYLELGFRPENIIGVESGEVNPKNLKPEAIEKLRKYANELGLLFELTKPRIREILTKMFQKNARKYGIQQRIGILDKVLKKEETTFDVVSLDFLGPININALSILKSIKSREGRTIVLTNFQAKRENLMQDYMIGMAGLRQQNGRYIIQGERHAQSLISPETLRDYSGKSLRDSRDDASVAQIIRGARALSVMSPRPSDIIEKIREIFTPELYERYAKIDSRILGDEGLIRHMITILSGTFDRVLDDNANLFFKGELKIFKINLPVLIRNILLYHHAEDIVQHRMYSYNATGTPMITDCLVLEYGEDNELYRFRQLIQFILSLAKLFTEKTISIFEKGVTSPEHEELNQYHFKVFDKKGVIKQGYRTSSDELKLQFQGQTLTSITLGKLVGSLTEYIKYKNGRNIYAEKRIILS